MISYFIGWRARRCIALLQNVFDMVQSNRVIAALCLIKLPLVSVVLQVKGFKANCCVRNVILDICHSEFLEAQIWLLHLGEPTSIKIIPGTKCSVILWTDEWMQLIFSKFTPFMNEDLWNNVSFGIPACSDLQEVVLCPML